MSNLLPVANQCAVSDLLPVVNLFAVSDVLPVVNQFAVSDLLPLVNLFAVNDLLPVVNNPTLAPKMIMLMMMFYFFCDLETRNSINPGVEGIIVGFLHKVHRKYRGHAFGGFGG